jgi:hypothetical protein
MLLNPCPISSEHLEYSGKLASFLAEASDLGDKFKVGRVYDDACDEGFTIVSARTGKEAVFALDHLEENEGDICAWHFVCVTPNLKHLKAVIFND